MQIISDNLHRNIAYVMRIFTLLFECGHCHYGIRVKVVWNFTTDQNKIFLLLPKRHMPVEQSTIDYSHHSSPGYFQTGFSKEYNI